MRPCWLRDLMDWAVVIGGGVIAGLMMGAPIGLTIWWMWLR